MDRDQVIVISELPLEVQQEIPYSIKTYKDEYMFSELPFDMQSLIEDYFEKKKSVTYSGILDAKPIITEYGDVATISSGYDLVLEYVKNYLSVQPGDYPFDPLFGCRLKSYLMKLDTKVQSQMISNELDRLVDSLSEDLNLDIQIKTFDINKYSSNGIDVDYFCTIHLKIGNIEKILKTQV